MAEPLALPTSGHGVAGSNPAGGEILPEPKRRFTAQSFSCSSFHRLEVTEILLKGCKTLTHPSIHHISQPIISLISRLMLHAFKSDRESPKAHCLENNIQYDIHICVVGGEIDM